MIEFSENTGCGVKVTSNSDFIGWILLTTDGREFSSAIHMPLFTSTQMRTIADKLDQLNKGDV